MTRLDDGAMRLREGVSVWQGQRKPDVAARERSAVELTTDIVVVGAGITGSFLAERLTREGHQVVLIDRHAPASGSTAASTAMLLWELDSSLLELEQRLGVEAAGKIAAHCQRQVKTISALCAELNFGCDFAARPSLYLAGNKLDAGDLREEHRLRAHLDIAGDYVESGALAGMGFVGEGALLYPGAAQVDPMKLARGLLEVACARGARVISPAVAMVYESLPTGVCVETAQGDVIRARKLVLASGYEMPDFVPAARHRIVSTWALATEKRAAPAWGGDALVWEASEPYLYMRSTAAGRIVVGGEDEQNGDNDARAGKTPEKVRVLLKAAEARLPGLRGAEADYAWSGAFGQTDDSLPLIGPVPGRPHCLAAYGYGGNGITFSALAAEMVAYELRGERHEMAEICALDRA